VERVEEADGKIELKIWRGSNKLRSTSNVVQTVDTWKMKKVE
jgi:hypothetical protein